MLSRLSVCNNKIFYFLSKILLKCCVPGLCWRLHYNFIGDCVQWLYEASGGGISTCYSIMSMLSRAQASPQVGRDEKQPPIAMGTQVVLGWAWHGGWQQALEGYPPIQLHMLSRNSSQIKSTIVSCFLMSLTCPERLMFPPAVILTTPPLTVTPPCPRSNSCSMELIVLTPLTCRTDKHQCI